MKSFPLTLAPRTRVRRRPSATANNEQRPSAQPQERACSRMVRLDGQLQPPVGPGGRAALPPPTLSIPLEGKVLLEAHPRRIPRPLSGSAPQILQFPEIGTR